MLDIVFKQKQSEYKKSRNIIQIARADAMGETIRIQD